MDFVGGSPTNRKGHEYLFFVFDILRKMCIPMPYKNTIKGQEETNIFIEWVRVHFAMPRTIILERNNIFLSFFWTILRENMETKLNIYTSFYPQMDGKT
jgi:hypothetical protein